MENETFLDFLKQMMPWLSHLSDMIHIKNEQSNRKADVECFSVCTTINELIYTIDKLIEALHPEGYECPFCDPTKFVVYGKCGRCGKEVNPPLQNMEGMPPIGFCTEKGSEMLRKLFKDRKDVS